MAVRKRGKTWIIDYYEPDGKRIVKGGFKRKKDAELEEAARKEAIDKGMYYEKAKTYTATLRDLVKEYKENFGDQASFKSAKKYWLKNFNEYFKEDTLLANIRYVHLETYRNHLKRKLVIGGRVRSIAAINREMSCLHHLFTKAVEWEMIKESPFNKGKNLLMKEDNERLRYLEEHEIPLLLYECPTHLRRVVVCAINTGMDRGELLNLKWSQIKNGFIYLPKYKTRPKRQVPINNDLKQMFGEIRKDQGLRSEYVFTYAASEDKLKGREPVRKRKKVAPAPQRIRNIKTSFKSACRRAGIEDFRFKDLRHTFASHFVMRGGTMKELQELMGHTTMTMRYAHLSQEHKKKAVNRLNGLTAPAKNSDGNNLVTFSGSSQVTTG